MSRPSSSSPPQPSGAPGVKKKRKHSTLADAPLEPPKPPKHERKFLYADEWRKLLAAARAKGPREEALLLVMYEAGLRREEPGLLRISYVEQLASKKVIFCWRGKGSRSADVHLSDVACKALGRWLDLTYPPGTKRHRNGFVFPGKYLGKRRGQKGITGRQVYNIIRELAESAGLGKKVAHPHILKHSRVQHILDAGFKANISVDKLYQTIAGIIGHSAARTTIEHYSAATGAEQQLVNRVTDDLVK